MGLFPSNVVRDEKAGSSAPRAGASQVKVSGQTHVKQDPIDSAKRGVIDEIQDIINSAPSGRNMTKTQKQMAGAPVTVVNRTPIITSNSSCTSNTPSASKNTTSPSPSQARTYTSSVEIGPLIDRSPAQSPATQRRIKQQLRGKH